VGDAVLLLLMMMMMLLMLLMLLMFLMLRSYVRVFKGQRLWSMRSLWRGEQSVGDGSDGGGVGGNGGGGKKARSVVMIITITPPSVATISPVIFRAPRPLSLQSLSAVPRTLMHFITGVWFGGRWEKRMPKRILRQCWSATLSL
jgi:hypothetical protein